MSGGSVPEHRGERGAHAPVRIGIEAGQHRRRSFRDRAARQRSQRRRADAGLGSRQQIEQRRRSTPGALDAAERGDRFEAHVRIGRRVAE